MHNTHHQLLTLLTGQVPTQKAAMKARVIMGVPDQETYPTI